MPTERVVFVFDVDHQLTAKELTSRLQTHAACIPQQLWVQQDGGAVSSDPLVGGQVLSG